VWANLGGQAAGGRRPEAAGYRTKNKNPTQRGKTVAYRNSNVIRAASKITHLGRLYNENKYKRKRNCKQERIGKKVRVN